MNITQKAHAALLEIKQKIDGTLENKPLNGKNKQWFFVYCLNNGKGKEGFIIASVTDYFIPGVVYFSSKNKAGKALKMLKDFSLQEVESYRVQRNTEGQEELGYWENRQKCKDLRAMDGFDY